MFKRQTASLSPPNAPVYPPPPCAASSPASVGTPTSAHARPSEPGHHAQRHGKTSPPLQPRAVAWSGSRFPHHRDATASCSRRRRPPPCPWPPSRATPPLGRPAGGQGKKQKGKQQPPSLFHAPCERETTTEPVPPSCSWRAPWPRHPRPRREPTSGVAPRGLSTGTGRPHHWQGSQPASLLCHGAPHHPLDGPPPATGTPHTRLRLCDVGTSPCHQGQKGGAFQQAQTLPIRESGPKQPYTNNAHCPSYSHREGWLPPPSPCHRTNIIQGSHEKRKILAFFFLFC
jgi:hypothetical protein